MEQKNWYLYIVDRHEGPYTADEIKKLVKKGEARDSSFVWKEGFADWVMLSDATEFGGAGPQQDGHGPASFAVTNPGGPDLRTVSPTASVFCLNKKGSFSGPFSLKTITAKVISGEVTPQDSIWKDGWTTFVQIGSVAEIMGPVHEVTVEFSTKSKGKGKNKKMSKNAMALGLAGAFSRSTAWYKSTAFLAFFSLISCTALYQFTAMGHLDWVFEAAKQKRPPLTPLPLEKATNTAGEVWDTVKPFYYQAIRVLPAPIRAKLSPIDLPDIISNADADKLRAAALTSLRAGAKVAAVLTPGELTTPSFFIATNIKQDLNLTALLRGKEGTLVGAFSFEKALQFEIFQHFGRTSRFKLDGDKAIPKGEYELVIFESAQQPFQTANLLQSLPKPAATPIVANGKVVVGVETFFLGGRKDAAYDEKLKLFNERVKARKDTEVATLRMYLGTLETLANESAIKFFGLANTPASRGRTAAWLPYHQKYLKIGAQLKQGLGGAQKDVVLTNQYNKLIQSLELAERLHAFQNSFIEKGSSAEVNMDSIRGLATTVVTNLTDLKSQLDKLSKTN